MSVVNIARESQSEWHAGHGTVDTTPVALGDSMPIMKHVIVRADLDNDDELLVGPKAGTAANGFRLKAGEQTPPIYVNDLSKVFVLAAAGSQDYSWIAC